MSLTSNERKEAAMTRQERKDEVRWMIRELEEDKESLPYFPKTRAGLLFGLCRHFLALQKEELKKEAAA